MINLELRDKDKVFTAVNRLKGERNSIGILDWIIGAMIGSLFIVYAVLFVSGRRTAKVIVCLTILCVMFNIWVYIVNYRRRISAKYGSFLEAKLLFLLIDKNPNLEEHIYISKNSPKGGVTFLYEVDNIAESIDFPKCAKMYYSKDIPTIEGFFDKDKQVYNLIVWLPMRYNEDLL